MEHCNAVSHFPYFYRIKMLKGGVAAEVRPTRHSEVVCGNVPVRHLT